jgi:pyruvate dehydrogenase E1 component alpha subunit
MIVNNGWAISVPLAEQTATQTLAQKAVAAGMPGVQVDGNDVFAVREVVSDALDTARRGGGPCVIEALTYRLSDHTTADDASRYRSAADVEAACADEPLIRLRSYLRKEGVWNDVKEQALLRDCALKVDAAVAEYLRFARPTTDAMFDHLFAALPKHLVEQRATARYYSSSSKLGSSSSKLGSSSSKLGSSSSKLGSSKPGASKTSGH